MTRTRRLGLWARCAVFMGSAVALLVATPMATAQSVAGPDGLQIDPTQNSPDAPGGPGVVIPTLFYGPVPGFTTAAYSAGATIAAPLGTLIPFHIEGVHRGQSVAWNGAEAVSTDGLTATCLVNTNGPISVTATIYPDMINLTCDLDVMAVTPGGLTFDLAAPAALTHKNPTNSELVSAYHNAESLAAFAIARDGSASTAVKRTLLAIPDTPKFSLTTGELTTDLLSSLIEWRVDGNPVGVGSNFFETKGVHHVEVGPPGHATVFDLTSYDVQFSSPDVVDGVIPTDRPITFTATTDPSGFEKNLQWIAATKLGSATPSTGAGNTFTTTFNDALGSGTSVVGSPWFGVKVGNIGVGQDPRITIQDWVPGITLTPGQSFHYHQENVEYQGLWSWLDCHFVTPGTIKIYVQIEGFLHFFPIEIAWDHISSDLPFDDWEWFLNNGNGVQTLSGNVQLNGDPPVAFPDSILNPFGTGHVHANVPVDPLTQQAELWKSFINIGPANEWWWYQAHFGVTVPFTLFEWYHVQRHFEQLKYTGMWVWITNVGTGPVTFDFHVKNQGLTPQAPTGTCPMLGDFNDDGVVDNADVAVLTSLLGSVCPQPQASGCFGDLNNDGVVDNADMVIMLANFGPCP